MSKGLINNIDKFIKSNLKSNHQRLSLNDNILNSISSKEKRVYLNNTRELLNTQEPILSLEDGGYKCHSISSKVSTMELDSTYSIRSQCIGKQEQILENSFCNTDALDFRSVPSI